MRKKYRKVKKATHFYTYYARNRAKERKKIPLIRQPQKDAHLLEE
jgi:hypothetical protein